MPNPKETLNTPENEQLKPPKNYLKSIMQKAKKAVDLMIGNAEDYTREDSGGDLKFDPRCMMKIDVTFDKNFLPKEKVVKLNLRGSRFFNEIKADLRELNTIFIIYPHAYAIQLDTRKDQWEKKLIRELNADYQLELQMIKFFNEDDIAGIYQRAGFDHIRNPYRLKENELLIIAGGFTNFNFDGLHLCQIEADVIPTQTNETSPKKYTEYYFTRFSEKAGAYFYVGGEWYYNLFIPEMYDPDNSLFFSLRIGDDSKTFKFFSDSRKAGIEIRGTIHSEHSSEKEKLIYPINPVYLSGSNAKNITLTAIYDIDKEEPPSVEILDKSKSVSSEKFSGKDQLLMEEIPFLEDVMILLPAPNQHDIPSYIMSVGDEKNGIKFFASSQDNEISILAPGREKKFYKRHIDDPIDYSIKFGKLGYSISNEFLSRFGDKELKVYFSWGLSNNMPNRIFLKEDFYILGRDPLANMEDTIHSKFQKNVVILNTGIESFWRIGTSRDHAIILRESPGKYRIFNISTSFPIYVVRKEDLEKPLISPFKLEHTEVKNEPDNLYPFLNRFYNDRSRAKKMINELSNQADHLELEPNDWIIIGNRVYKFIIPLLMESVLSDRVQMSVLRKIRESSSVLISS